MENYEADLQDLQNGIVSRCVFNDILNFHIARNPSADIMHDVWEGMAVYVLEGVLTHLIMVQNEITLEEVNNAIRNFSYGSLEAKNVPHSLEIQSYTENSVIGLKSNIKCKQSAAEMACLSRYLSLMIGDKIKNKNKYWLLYLKFRKIVALLSAPTFVIAEIYELKDLIKTFLDDFIALLRLLPPKGHIFTHFVELLLLLRPLILIWGMPFERKNREIKAIATGISSHKDLPYTIAVSNQLYMCYVREKVKSLGNKIKLGAIINDNADIDFKRKYTTAKGSLHSKEYSFLKKYGRKYEVGSIIVFKIAENPVFARIKNIYEAKHHIYFHVHLYHAWEVEELNLNSSNFCLVNIQDLPDTDQCVIHRNKNGLFVATRYEL